jgi:hypothetical protein
VPDRLLCGSPPQNEPRRHFGQDQRAPGSPARVLRAQYPNEGETLGKNSLIFRIASKSFLKLFSTKSSQAFVRSAMLEVNARNMVRSAFPADAQGKRALEQSIAQPDGLLDRAAWEWLSVPGWSPIVVAGIVRILEFSLIVLVGGAIYALYLFPSEGFQWHYVGAVFGIALMAMLAFQTADIYQVQAFRGYEKQYFRLASAWTVVFLVAMSITFVAKLGDHYSRVWLGSFFGVACSA